MTRFVRILLLLAALLLVLGSVLLFVDIDAPVIGQRVLDRLGARTGMELEAETFRFNVLRGVRISGVHGSSASGEVELRMRIEEVRLSYRLLPLLRGSWEFDSIVVDQPVVELFTTDPGDAFAAAAVPAAIAVPDETDSPTRLAISSIVFRDGRLVTRSDEGPGLEIEGLQLSLRNLRVEPAPTALAGLSGEGTIGSSFVRIGDFEARDSRGPVVLDRGRLILDGHRFSTDIGAFTIARLEVDLLAEPFSYQIALQGDPLDTGRLLGASVDGAPGRFSLEGAGRGPGAAGLVGTGRVTLPGGTVPPSPYLELIDEIFRGVQIVGSPWDPVEVDFTLDEGRVGLTPFTLETRFAKIDVQGELELEGPIDLDLRVRAPREHVRIPAIPSALLDLLEDDGYVSVPLEMTGTLEAPRLRPDWDELAKIRQTPAARDLGRRLRDSIDREVRKLLDRE
jgi:hypothetical protein